MEAEKRKALSMLGVRAVQPSNKHSAKLTPDLSVQKLTCVHRHISAANDVDRHTMAWRSKPIFRA